MVVLHKPGLIYIHIPKCGGTSVAEALAESAHDAPFSLGNISGHVNDGDRQPPFKKHMTALECREVFEVLSWPWEAYYKFAIIRNPWKILHSDYYYCQASYQKIREVKDGWPGWLAQRYEHFVKKCEQAHSLSFPEFCHWLYSNPMDVKSFTETYCQDKSGSDLVDFIGRQESLEQDFHHVCNAVGITCPTLPWINTSTNQRDYRVDYTEDLRKFVGNLFEYDIKRFHYEF